MGLSLRVISALLLSQAVINNEGELYLDNCDFSGSIASVLILSDGKDAVVVIRNAVLGNDNCERTIHLHNNDFMHRPPTK